MSCCCQREDRAAHNGRTHWSVSCLVQEHARLARSCTRHETEQWCARPVVVRVVQLACQPLRPHLLLKLHQLALPVVQLHLQQAHILFQLPAAAAAATMPSISRCVLCKLLGRVLLPGCARADNAHAPRSTSTHMLPHLIISRLRCPLLKLGKPSFDLSDAHRKQQHQQRTQCLPRPPAPCQAAPVCCCSLTKQQDHPPAGWRACITACHARCRGVWAWTGRGTQALLQGVKQAEATPACRPCITIGGSRAGWLGVHPRVMLAGLEQAAVGC